MYIGVNAYSVLGTCAEMIAIGSAISYGEREFECIVAVRGEKGEEILAPCGNCRQLLNDYMPHGDVIINKSEGARNVKISELLSYAYCVENLIIIRNILNGLDIALFYCDKFINIK
ncbi:hypothetical protein I3900191A7_22840 [Clostridium baratii]|uniref:hypothetical protein n=1 Tax=Clostridium baratii TaxID=1561 RepID=UPI0036F3CFBE